MCWCNCNFGMYSIVYLILYPDVPIERIICISLYPDVPIGRVINIINSCKVNEINPGAHEWEKRSSHKWEREQLSEIIFLSLGFTFAIGVHSIFEEVAGFSPLWFPKENSLCPLSLVLIVVHVILSDKILRSYCLNDKNLTQIPKSDPRWSKGSSHSTFGREENC